ncbi:MAG: hypothetical protein HY315_06270 [Acidobacteria bacterium]|nr:hypothetical protein [Acidobacteriota bacterium]
MRKKLFPAILLLGCAAVLIYFLGSRQAGRKDMGGYEFPRYPAPAASSAQLSDDELKELAKLAVRNTEGDTALGKISPGQKVLLEISDGQDMKLLGALMEAYRERGVEANYIYDHQIVEEILGIPKAEALRRGILVPGGRAAIAGGGGTEVGPRDGYKEALWFPSLLPENLRREVEDENAKLAATEGVFAGNPRDPKARAQFAIYRGAMKKYLEIHPYDGIFGGRPNRIFMITDIGAKWKGYFNFKTVRAMGGLSETKFPDDVWRLVIERTTEIVPWIDKVRVTDPEGTDYGFSVTPDQAELWSRGANVLGAVYMHPFQASRELYALERWRGQVVVDAEGVVAGTVGHVGYYPRIKVYLKKGMVERVEGGGRFGDLWRTIMAQEWIEKLHYPFLPYPGFFYFCETVMQTHPKASDPESVHYGFGVGNLAPEVVEYAARNNVPNWHGFHVHQYFTTYEVKTRTSEKRFKIMDKGHLAAYDDPEVRALASKYGKVDEILKKAWVRAIPGINVPGDYEKDYGKDPLSYVRREAEEVKNGTYKYLYRPEFGSSKITLQ